MEKEGKREEEVHCGIPIVLDEVVALMDSASLETPTNQKETLSTSSNDKKWVRDCKHLLLSVNCLLFHFCLGTGVPRLCAGFGTSSSSASLAYS